MSETDIYIRERNGEREIRIPWIPEEINYESGGTLSITYNVMKKGEVVVPIGIGLSKIRWESQFPGEARNDTSMMRGEWKEPAYYHNIIEDWRKNQTPLNVMVTGYPINKDVFVEDYKFNASGGFGDIEYEINLMEDKDIVIKYEKIENDNTTDPQRPAQDVTTYTIKKGDTLWSIAQRFLGSGAKWETIYEANKDIIEKAAKAHGRSSSNRGWWIYPGVSIKIQKS